MVNRQVKVVIPSVARGIPGPPGPAGTGGHGDHTYLDESGSNSILPAPVLTSPNGSHYRLRVDDLGNITTAFVAYDPDVTGRASGRGFLAEAGDRLISSTSFCFKGDPMVTEEPFTITALATEANLVAGGSYRGIIVTGRDVVEEILAVSTVVVPATTGYGEIVFPINNLVVPGGQRIVVMTGRVDQGDGHVYPVDAFAGARSGFTWQGIPATEVGSSCSRIVTANPVVGTPINRGKGYNAAPFNVKVDWTRA